MPTIVTVMQRSKTGRSLPALATLGMALALIAATPTTGDDAAPKFFKICKGQTYALCAVAGCFVFNDLAYCKCDVKSGDSISLPFQFGQGQDVCSVNAEGADNGYMVNTFSVPESVIAPGGNKALYTCPARTSDGAYAQCDGGICFTSTESKSFPGFNR